MRTRTCESEALYTGASSCPYDRETIEGALVVPHGYKLPADLDGEALEEACHAARSARVYPINRFVEYAKNGGEAQVSAVGYGPNQVSGISALTDAFTMEKFNEAVAQSTTRTMNTEYDVYFYDKNNVIYGYDDGTDTLAGFPMSSIYPTITSYPTSGAKATLLINFCYRDARKAFENANFEQLDFSISSFAYGLTPVKFISVGAKKYKLVEALGGLDRTAEFASLISGTPSTVLKGSEITAISYSADTGELTVTGDGVPELKDPSVLYSAGIKGIEQA